MLKLMEEMRSDKNNNDKYEEINKRIRTLCKEAKEAWIDENFREIEQQYNTQNGK